MSFDIEFGVASMFRDTVRQSMVLEMRKPADWERYRAIETEFRERSRQEVDQFETNRAELLAAARKEIIDKAGSKTFEHPTPFGTDRFNKDEIERQAVTKIVNDHQRRLIGIRDQECAAYDELRDDIHTREGVRNRARDAFSRATDRRRGGDRRMPKQER